MKYVILAFWLVGLLGFTKAGAQTCTLTLTKSYDYLSTGQSTNLSYQGCSGGTVTWDHGLGTGNNKTVSPTATTTYSATCTPASGAPCSQTVVVHFIDCSITATASPAVISSGQSSVLSFTGCVGGSVDWVTSNDIGIGSGNNITVTPTVSTTYIAQCNKDGGYCLGYTSVAVSDCFITASASPSSINAGQSSVLSYTGCTGGTVTWNNGLGTGNTKTVTPTSTTTYQATCAPSGRGASCSGSVTVNVTPCSIITSASSPTINSGQSTILGYENCTNGTVSWDNGLGTGNNKTVMPTVTTTYTATCTPTGGGNICTSSVTVTVYTPCSVSASASPTTINAGQSSLLTYFGCTGGTVSWDNGLGTGNNKTVSPSTTTTYIATCSPSGGGASCTSSVVINVNACNLTTSASPSSINAGQSTLLTYSGCTNGMVSWDNGLGSGNNKTVTPSITTTYSATCTPTGGGNVCTSSVQVTVTAAPCSLSTSASPSTINSGQSSLLTYSGCSGGTVSWNNGLGTGNNKTVTPSVTTVYSATCTPSGGGNSCVSAVTVTVNGCSVIALASSATINAGQTTTLAYENCTNGTVTWDNGAGTGNNLIVSPSTTTTYQATCTPNGGGNPCTSSVTVTVNPCNLVASANPSTVNAGQSSLLTYTGCSNGIVSWNNGLGSGNNKTVTPSITTTYSATCTPTGGGNICTSLVTVTVNAPCSMSASANPATINAGQSSLLTYSGCSGGTVSWDNGLGIGNNKTVSPSVTTIYSATCTPTSGGNACTSSVIVTVNTPCSVSASASPSSINAGQSSLLTYSGCSGGTVSWDNGLGTGNNKTVTPSATTTYVATCSPAGGGSPCTSSVTVNVLACNLTTSASSSTINTGQSTVLSFAGCTGGTVSWDNGLGTGNNKTVSPSTTTTYQATCSPTGGGTPCTSTVTVTVHDCAFTTSASSATINAGQSTVLSYTGCTYGLVSWDNGVGTGNNKTVTPSTTTTYLAVCAPKDGGTTCTNLLTVTVIPCTFSTSASPVNINAGQSSVLTYTGCENGTVSWDNGLGTGNNKTVTPSATTTYQATCTPTGGGTPCTSSITVTVRSCNLSVSASQLALNAGQSSILSYIGCTNGTVSWDNGLGTGNTRTVSPSTTTTYQATCAPTGGGTSCTSSVTITVLACNLTASASPVNINAEQSSVLTYTGCSNGTVSWNNGAGSGNSISVSPTTTTTYQATCTPTGGGTPCTSSVTITVSTCNFSASASPTTINAGQNSVLTYEGCTNGTVSWDNDLGTGNNKTVTPSATTIYRATCVPTSGGTSCSSSVTVTVSTCNFSVGASPATINSGQSTVLSYTGCANGTVSWDNGLGTGNNKTVTPSATTTYQGTCTPTGGGTPCTSSITVTVNGCNLTTSASPGNINAGQSSVLTYTGCENGTVTWDNNLGIGNNKTVSPSTTTTYQATCSLNGGGTTCTSSVTVVVTALPCSLTVSASPSTINAGQNSVLTYSGCIGGTVSWDNGLGTGNNKTVSPSTTTTYQAICTPTDGGNSCSSTVTVTVSSCNFTVGASLLSLNAGQSSVLSYTGCSNGTVSWDNGVGSGNNLTASPSATTTYQATCTPTGGGTPCTNTVTITVNGCNLTTSANPSSINAGQSTLLTYTGCNNGTVSWDNGLGTGNNKTVNPTATTTYVATCNPTGGGNACTSSITISVNPCNIGTAASPTTINAGQNSIVTYTGCSNGTVSWDNGLGTGNAKSVNPSVTTTYIATCTPNGGGTPCTSSVTVSVIPCSIDISASPSRINVGQSSTLSYTGCPNGTVSWNNGLGTGNSKTVFPTATTTYQATCTPTGGGNSCSTEFTLTVTPAPISISSSSVKKPTCVDAKNGGLTINLDRRIVRGESTIRLTLSRNGATVVTYFFDGPSFTAPENLEAGMYSALIETLIGSTPSAQTSGNITITNPDPVTFSLAKTDVNCFGGSDAKIEIVAAGGTGIYRYQLASAGSNDFANGNRHTLTGLLPRAYTIQVFDSFNCPSTSQSITVSQPASAVALTKVSQKDPRGFETKDGQATVQVVGGTPGYMFEWLDETDNSYGVGVTTGSTNKNSTLRGGIYRARVYDSNYAVATQKGGCSSVVSFSLTEPPVIEAKIDLTTAISCFGKKDGVILVTPTGGVPFTKSTAYVLSLRSQSNPSITFSSVQNSFATLPAGQYMLTVTDSNEVSRSFPYSLIEPQKVTTSVVSTKDLLCSGDKNGVIELSATGGNGGYTASWSNSSKGLKISNLPAGTYAGVVSDAKGCRSDILYAQVKEPAKLDATFTVKSPTCYSACDGTIDAGISGGITPYSFAWDGRTDKATRLEKLCGGESLSFKVVDANGCQLTKTSQIAQPVKLDIKLESERKVCQGQSVLLDVTNPLAQSYRWTLPNGQTATTPILEAKQPGIYTVSLFDQARCEFKSAVTVRQVQPTGKIRFAATSTAPINEPIVILNLSDPAPVSMDWMTPAGAVITERTKDKLLFSMPTLGDYVVGIKAVFAECELYQIKPISIVDFVPKTVSFFPGQAEPTLLVSPNPVVSDFNVNLRFEKPTNFTLRLYNSTNPDKVIFETKQTEIANYTTQINALGLGAGTYILAIETATNRFLKRIIVIK
ncbi:hypothetical protein GCM10028805_38780 [Spirosoma harenae]